VSDIADFRPEELVGELNRHGVRYVLIGGLAALLHGSPYITYDSDICPARDASNLERLAGALIALDARIRAEGAEAELPFDRSPQFLARMEILNLVTRHGNLDISFRPSGTAGYEDLARGAVWYEFGAHRVWVASLLDVVRSKQAANRDKDRLVLPVLRELLERNVVPDEEDDAATDPASEP
jgi:hypothetical protein